MLEFCCQLELLYPFNKDINDYCATYRPHEYMSSPLGPPTFLSGLKVTCKPVLPKCKLNCFLPETTDTIICASRVEQQQG